MASWGSFSFLFGPVVAVAALVVLVFVMRWAFSSGVSIISRPAKKGTPAEYGMLVPVADPVDAAQGELMRSVLANAGYITTLVDTSEGLRVMAWPAQADGARAVLSTRQF